MFNLLSSEEKKHIASLKIYYILRSISFSAISLTAIVLVVLIFSYLLLDGENTSLLARIEQERAIKEEEKIASINEEISKLNQTVADVTEIQSTYVQWSAVLLEISEIVPQGIIVSSLNIKTTDLQYTMTGTANTRDTLLQFQANVENLPYVTNLNSPVTNFTQKEDINFTVSGDITNEITH